MKECPRCGAMMADHEIKCVGCGTATAQTSSPTPPPASVRQAPSAMPTQTVCPYCGSILPSAMARLCPSCKRSLVTGVSSARAVATGPVTARGPATADAGTARYQNIVMGIGVTLVLLVLTTFTVFSVKTGTLSGSKVKTEKAVDDVNEQLEDSPYESPIEIKPGAGTTPQPAPAPGN